MAKLAEKPSAKVRILEAAVTAIRAKGYAASTVDDLCAAAGVTKGAFFHHFPTKDALGLAAAGYWAERTRAKFEAAPFHDLAEPLDRVLGYLDFRRAQLAGRVAEFSCLAGTLVQETYATHPALREACERTMLGHAALIEADIAEAMHRRGLTRAGWTARSLSLHIQSVLQGGIILAKATGTADAAVQSIDHLRRHVALLFANPGEDDA
jgi:TetR/AcrR family transcriptional repressor of nem operon